jgi:hypothetical protein
VEANMKVVSRKNVVGLLLLLTVIGMSNNPLGGNLTRGFSQQELIDWDNVKSTYMEYLKNQIPENGERLLAALPQDKTRNQKGDVSGAMYSIYDSYPVLKLKVLGGDRYLTRAAFRLLNFSDAAFSEALDEILGNLATENPKLFLEVLYEHKEGWFIKHVRPPVLGTSSEDLRADILEWKKRIKALKTVRETRYRQIRDQCIRLLEGSINQCLSENTWELIDWDKVRSTYMDYLKNPTAKSGEHLLEALPRERIED